VAVDPGKGKLMLQPIIMFVADNSDIFTVLGAVLDCRDYSVIYYTEQHLREATMQSGWTDVAVIDLRGIALEQVEELLFHLRQFPFSRTVPVLICSDGIYCPTACASLCRSAQHWGTTLLEPPATSGRLLNVIQQRLHRLSV
jgi:DNA-binding NtrC family response regulator